MLLKSAIINIKNMDGHYVAILKKSFFKHDQLYDLQTHAQHAGSKLVAS